MGSEPEERSDRPGAELDGTLDQARSGDLQAFDRLITWFGPAVLRTARALLGNREDARDAAQEVFFRVYRHLARFDPRRDFAPWLHRVAVNVCRDAYRKRTRLPTVPLDELDSGIPASLGDQDADADARERQRIVRRALGTLSVREREAIVLRDVEGISTAEVARVLGCREVTVRTHLSRGRLKLHAALARLERRQE